MRKVILILIVVSISSLALAQDKYINRDIRPNMSLENTKIYTLDFFNGLSFPQGDLNNFVKNGFNSGVLVHRNFSKKLSLGFSANYSRFNYRRNFGTVEGSGRQELSTTSFDVGPQYNIKLGRFTIEFYGRSGLSIVNSPQSSMMFQDTDITITTLEAYKSTALTARLGANMTAYICEGLDFYFSSEYLTSLNSDMNYQTRDLSDAMRDDGTLNSNLANELPYSNESLSLSMLNVNIGVRISIGGHSSKRRSNSIYKANEYSARNSIYEGLSFQYTSDKKNVETRVENSSRSNSSKNGNHGTDKRIGNSSDTTQSKKNLVQSNNLNRINNSSIVVPNTDEKDTKLNSKSKPNDEATLADIPVEKLKLKTKSELSKERRKRKRIERKLKRLKSKL